MCSLISTQSFCDLSLPSYNELKKLTSAKQSLFIFLKDDGRVETVRLLLHPTTITSGGFCSVFQCSIEEISTDHTAGTTDVCLKMVGSYKSRSPVNQQHNSTPFLYELSQSFNFTPS